MLPTPVFWPGEFHGLYSSWDRKESDMTEWSGRSPGGGHGNLSRVLAWRIAWQRSLVGYNPQHLRRGRHNWAGMYTYMVMPTS